MSKEVRQIVTQFKSTLTSDITEEGMIKLLKAFLFYRPDFGYSQVII